MRTLKKINLKGLTEILSEKELKNVLGGSDGVDCSQGDYCEQLRCIVLYNIHLWECGTCLGAAHGAALCGFTIECNC